MPAAANCSDAAKCGRQLAGQRQVLILVREIPSHSRAGGNPLNRQHGLPPARE